MIAIQSPKYQCQCAIRKSVVPRINYVQRIPLARGFGEVAQAMYTYVSECKNDKINGKKKKDPPGIWLLPWHSR
jgi:hypothetical protein